MDLMINDKSKIFISYTVRDGNINVHFLNKLYNQISPLSVPYIDLIHNDSLDKQSRVMKELNNSDYVFLIRTEHVDNSEWVNKEISLAKKLNIPVLEFEFEELIEDGFLSITKTLVNLKGAILN
jgi:hypothetical protein